MIDVVITAPQATIRAWAEESARLLAATRVHGLPPQVVETLYHASGILQGSVINAIPGGPEMLRDGFAKLAKQVVAEQERDLDAEARGEEGQVCPLPNPDRSRRRCGCGPAGVAGCSGVAWQIGEHPAQLAADLDVMVASDRAQRDGGAQ
jgi:hypothetical protein